MEFVMTAVYRLGRHFKVFLYFAGRLYRVYTWVALSGLWLYSFIRFEIKRITDAATISPDFYKHTSRTWTLCSANNQIKDASCNHLHVKKLMRFGLF